MKILTRIARITACVALLNIAVPGTALLTFGTPVKDKIDETLTQRAARLMDLSKRRARSASRILSSKEEQTLQGKSGENPYLAGQNKWDVIYKGINLLTGNYSTSATDMSFDGGYGIPVNITRSYSANSIDEGPFGKGWTLSADVRSTAGGIFKSGNAPVRSVPVSLKERASTEDDPNVTVEPAAAISVVDAGGAEETIQKDVDGVLTTPPWDKNTYDSVYEMVTLNGSKYQVLLSNSVRTPEGTVYTYAKKGSYPNGTVPWDNSTATPEAANVLKVTSATDRQGNVTNYIYGSNFLTFQKSNGVTSENPLNMVTMPGGHIISFTWGISGAATGRVTSVSDNSGTRTVTYNYTGTAGHGLLASVTSPGGKTTSYGYGTAATTNPWLFMRLYWAHQAADQEPFPYSGPAATNLLTSITDPRGLTTQISYLMRNGPVGPYRQLMSRVSARRITQPNGVTLNYFAYNFPYYSNTSSPSYIPTFEEVRPTPTPTLIHSAELFPYVDTGLGTFNVTSNTNFNNAPAGNLQTDPWPAAHLNTTWYKSEKRYSLIDQNLVYEAQKSFAPRSKEYRVDSFETSWGNDLVPMEPWLVNERGFVGNYANSDWLCQIGTETTTTYNFLGAPLSKSNDEVILSPNAGPDGFVHRYTGVSYAYWGADKYYQQKAVKDPSNRYIYSDYYPNTAPAGKRGQTYRQYDPKTASFYLDTSVIPPTSTPTANYWKYQLKPSSTEAYSSQFDYDGKGRLIDSWKLQKTASPWSYVQSHTIYGGDGSPSWGQASQVTEDVGGIGRTTQTLAYTSWGQASDIVDAAGHEFSTTYDGDGVVQSVTRTDVSPNVPVISYTYGSSGVSNGQITSLTDGSSGVVQNIAYASSGGGIAQPVSITEINGSDTYSTAFTYNGAGDRETATYTTPSGTSRWGYYDYLTVGEMNPGRVFQTFVKLDSSGNRTPEEFHYAYDTSGRICEATFAQSPYIDNTGQSYVPTAGNPYYDTAHPASVRGRAHYEYDGGGRVTLVSHWWDTFNRSNGTYSSEAILANQCDYETTGLNRGLKTASRFYVKSPSSPTTFSLERTETYGYDPTNDTLTSANYGDGLPNATPTWSYDIAGNRNDSSTVDNLNRATVINGIPVTNDILGNRLTKGGVTYGWDALNRLTSLSGSASASYQYRADGLRVIKSTGGVTTRYRYDGQMGIEDTEAPATGTPTVTRYGIGARGVDYIERTQGSNITAGFPIFDAHGNNIATLSRNGGGYTVSDRRSYDAWGVVRSQQSAGDPKLRYCGNLGHKADDESGLIYMRARYYEPNSGRFISEDFGHDGANWFTYCGNNPVSGADRSGKAFTNISFWIAAVGGGLFAIGFAQLALAVLGAITAKTPAELTAAITLAGSGVTLTAVGAGMMSPAATVSAEMALAGTFAGASMYYASNYITAILAGAAAGGKMPNAEIAVGAISLYSLIVLSYIVSLDFDSDSN